MLAYPSEAPSQASDRLIGQPPSGLHVYLLPSLSCVKLVTLAQGMTFAVKSASQICSCLVRRSPACDCRGLSPSTVHISTVHISSQAIMLRNVAVAASYSVVRVSGKCGRVTEI